MLLRAGAVRSVFLPAQPDTVAAYFSRNERLLERLVGPSRVERLSAGVYRVALRSFATLGVSVRPVLDIRFVDAPGQTTMEALAVRALEGPANLSLQVQFTGAMRFQPHGKGCLVDCETLATVSLGLPFPFSLLPEGLLQATATAVLGAALEATASRFEQLVVSDFTQARLSAA